MELGKIRKRIKSIKSTAQITKAMELVAAVKMQHAQSKALKGRDYSSLMTNMLSSLSAKVSKEAHKLFQERAGDVGVLFISPDRGLCGALNSNLYSKLLTQKEFEYKKARYINIGKKGRRFILRNQVNLIGDFVSSDRPDYAFAKTLAKLTLINFLEGKISSLYVLYTHFESTLKQTSTITKLLPIEKSQVEKENLSNGEYLFEPDAGIILASLLPHYVEMRIYQLLLESAASEHSGRMVAMKSATDNALDLVEELTLTYNGARQEAITNELLDITTSGMAMGA